MTKSDCEQIQELMATYAGALDARDFPALMECFVPDATVVYEGFSRTLQGHSEIASHMRRALEPLDGTQHLFANFLIDVDTDTSGRLSCDILAQHWRRGAVGGDTYFAGGKYNVEVRRMNGQWRFARLAARSLWSSGNRDLLPNSK